MWATRLNNGFVIMSVSGLDRVLCCPSLFYCILCGHKLRVMHDLSDYVGYDCINADLSFIYLYLRTNMLMFGGCSRGLFLIGTSHCACSTV